MLYESLNGGQKEIFDRLVNGENIFITGNAGTGKSFLVKAFDEWCSANGKALVKTAPTGVAALEIGGATLHKQFGFEIGLDFKEVTEESVIASKKLKFLNRVDKLLIDEISMERMDNFDRLMQILFYYNQHRKRKHKNPIQLIFVGDFYQLPPVISKDERPLLEEHYGRPIGDGYCFQSRYWRMFNIQLCNLTEVVRQVDTEFCKALDECKEADKNCLQFIRQASSKSIIPDAIWVCGKNETARQKNESELEKINKPLHTFSAKFSGDATRKDKLCDEEFKCKEGARVVFLVNDTLGAYQNGSMGTVMRINSDIITVKVDDRKDYDGTLIKGRDVLVEAHAFCKYKYESKTKDVPLFENGADGSKVPVIDPKTGKQKVRREMSLERVETGRAEQFPLRLGYAVTIHKSQGQTYDAMNLMPEIWDNGQLYVALSRCKAVENLHIEGYLSERMLKTSDEVLAFYNNPEGYSFFGDGIATIHVPEKYKDRILALIEEWETGTAAPQKQSKEVCAWGAKPNPVPASRSWGTKPQTEAETRKAVEDEKQRAEKERRERTAMIFRRLREQNEGGDTNGVQLSLFACGE